jgi:hypothetical protein
VPGFHHDQTIECICIMITDAEAVYGELLLRQLLEVDKGRGSEIPTGNS